ncbi:MAG: hypothetical protein ACFFDI_33170 [Promethearchaeota archaeon]
MYRPTIEIITPAGECSCSFSTWINRVWDILNEYREEIIIVSLVSDTPRAKELGGGSRSVFINDEQVAVFNLERKLKELIKKE